MGDKSIKLNLQIQNGVYAVCRLGKDEQIPAWAKGEFVSITRTNDELSVVCSEDAVPEGIKSEKAWKCLKVLGPLDFSLVGIFASLAEPLARGGISIFAISTFDADYLLVKNDMVEKTKEILSQTGHTVK
jgi:hypothetical protein